MPKKHIRNLKKLGLEHKARGIQESSLRVIPFFYFDFIKGFPKQ